MDTKKIIQDIKEAIAGTDQDFTTGSLKRAIFLLSVPMVLEMMMESIFAIADIFFVSKLGADAVATVGITESLITIIYSLGIGLGVATTALISRRIGEKNIKGANRAAFQAIIIGIVTSLMIGLPGIFFASTLLDMMGASPHIQDNLSDYTAIMLGGNGVIMLLFIINAVFRSAGDAAIAMRVLFVANILNIILDPCLIFGWGPFPAMGIKGAAIATTIGRGTAVAYQIYLLFRGRTRIKLRLRDFGIDFKVIGQILKLSIGTIGQYLIATSSWIGLVRIIAIFGSDVVAGYTIAIRIIVFALLPAFGISNAASTLVGQNLGAGNPERAEKSAKMIGKINMIMLGIISLILIFFPYAFIKPFSGESSVIEHGVVSLQIISYGFVFYALGMVMVHTLNGAGDTITPTWINFFCFWIIEIPLAYFLAITLNWEAKGVFYAIPIAESIMTILAFYFFKKGKWKLKQV